MKEEDKHQLLSIVSYFYFVGWIIAYLLNNQKPSYLTSFHLRQALGVNLLMLIGHWTLLYPIVGLVALILAVMGIVAAIQRRTTPLPVVGELFQDWFKGI